METIGLNKYVKHIYSVYSDNGYFYSLKCFYILLKMTGCNCLNKNCKCTKKNTFDWVLLIIIGVLVVLALFLVILLWTQTPKCITKYQKVIVYQPVEMPPSEELKGVIPERKTIYLPEIPKPSIPINEPSFDEFNEPNISEPNNKTGISEPSLSEASVDETIDNSLNVPDFDIIPENPVIQKSFVTTLSNIPTVSLDNLANASVASARSIPTRNIKINKNIDIIKCY